MKKQKIDFNLERLTTARKPESLTSPEMGNVRGGVEYRPRGSKGGASGVSACVCGCLVVNLD